MKLLANKILQAVHEIVSGHSNPISEPNTIPNY